MSLVPPFGFGNESPEDYVVWRLQGSSGGRNVRMREFVSTYLYHVKLKYSQLGAAPPSQPGHSARGYAGPCAWVCKGRSGQKAGPLQELLN